MSLRARLDRLQGRVSPRVAGMRVTLYDLDGAVTTDRVLIPGSQPGVLPRYCAPEDFPRLYPHGEIVSQIILEYADDLARRSLLQTWLDAEPLLG
jgi:hypothetical protein